MTRAAFPGSVMVRCQNCGESNAETSQFCRFCGVRFTKPEPRPAADAESYQFDRRPYSWKTDEYQTQSEARDMFARQPAAQLAQPPRPATPFYQAPGVPDASYRCPYCMSQFFPRMEKRISTAGWITFALLLVFVFPLFWIGFFIKEDVPVCSNCNRRLSQR